MQPLKNLKLKLKSFTLSIKVKQGNREQPAYLFPLKINTSLGLLHVLKIFFFIVPKNDNLQVFS